MASARLFALSLALLGCSPTAGQTETPQQAVASTTGPAYPALSGRVVDQADLLSPEQEQRLTARLQQLEGQVGPQLVVATVNSLQGYPIEDYSIGLVRRWEIGHRDRNDGLLILVAPTERKVRIEVGTGLERRITDPYAAKVIQEQMIPEFRQAHYPEGIERGVAALTERLASRMSEQEIARVDGVIS